MKKQFIFIVLAVLVFCSCEPSVISQGRTAYKEYFNNTLKDPESLVIYKEEIIAQDETGATFVLDAGARNSFGGMVRDTYTIRTIGTRMVDVKEYDTRTLPKEETEEETKEIINFTYKQKMAPMIGLDFQTYIGKTFVLKDSCICLTTVDDFPIVIEAAQKGDLNKLKAEHGKILPSGTKVKIIAVEDDLFKVEYKDKYGYTEKNYIEQSAIF